MQVDIAFPDFVTSFWDSMRDYGRVWEKLSEAVFMRFPGFYGVATLTGLISAEGLYPL